MGIMEDGVKPLTPSTKPCHLRDTSVNGKGTVVFIATLTQVIRSFMNYTICVLLVIIFLCGSSLPPAAQDREQLKMELQQVNQQITQQTRCMEVSLLRTSIHCSIVESTGNAT